MAGLNARSDSFIEMLLAVSGRARVADLQGMSEDEAVAALHAYVETHPERSLRFDGRTLVPVEVSPMRLSQPPAESPALGAPREFGAPLSAAAEPLAAATADSAEAAQVQADVAYPAQYPVAPNASPVPAPVPEQPAASGSEEMPSWFYEESAPAHDPNDALPTHEIAFGRAVPSAPTEAVSDYGVPQAPSPGGFYGVPDAVQPEYIPVADTLVGEDTLAEPPTPSTFRDTPEEYIPYEPVGVVTGQKMQWWWYLIAFFFWPWGGIVGYFVVRRGDPAGARNLLVFTAAFLIVSLLLAVAMVLLVLPAVAVGAPAPIM